MRGAATRRQQGGDSLPSVRAACVVHGARCQAERLHRIAHNGAGKQQICMHACMRSGTACLVAHMWGCGFCGRKPWACYVLRPLAVVKGERRLRRFEDAICTGDLVRLHAKVLQIASESRYDDVSQASHHQHSKLLTCIGCTCGQTASSVSQHLHAPVQTGLWYRRHLITKPSTRRVVTPHIALCKTRRMPDLHRLCFSEC